MTSEIVIKLSEIEFFHLYNALSHLQYKIQAEIDNPKTSPTLFLIGKDNFEKTQKLLAKLDLAVEQHFEIEKS
jgi:hypothetical protein